MLEKWKVLKEKIEDKRKRKDVLFFFYDCIVVVTAIHFGGAPSDKNIDFDFLAPVHE